MLTTEVANNIPAGIRGLFNKLPLLKSESHRQYSCLLADLVTVLKPKDVIDWLLLKDIADYGWEALRLRALRAPLIDAERKHALSAVLQKIQSCMKKDYVVDAEEASTNWFKDPKVRADVAALLDAHGLDENCIVARAFVACARSLEDLANLEGWAVAHRNSALRELEARRTKQVKANRTEVVDADVVDAEVVRPPRLKSPSNAAAPCAE